MKIRTTLLVGAGAISGLVAGAAAPAGAAIMKQPAPSCTSYSFDGTVNSGPDQGSEVVGNLCIGATVSGSVSFGDVYRANAAAAPALMEAGGVQVRGATLFNRIAFAGIGQEQARADATTAAVAAVRAPARTETEFILAAGQVEQRARLAPTAATNATIARLIPSYSGNFAGLRAGDSGTWEATPDAFLQSPS